jgi:hypothetical protein
MLFGTGRLFQQLATPLGPPFGNLGLTATTSLPAGSQVGDICIHHFTRTVTSEGSQPSGFTVIHRESLGAVGYVGWYAKVLTSSDITAGAVTGGPTTNISSRWTYVTRPSSPVSTISTERLETADAMGTTFQKLTMTGTFTRPAIVMANAVTIGSTLNTKIDITPSVNKTIFNPAAFNSVAFDIVGTNDDNSARSTNQPTVTSESRYFMILVAIKAI